MKLRKGGAAGSVLMMLSACGASSVEAPIADAAVIDRGKAAAVRLGCGACHDMPGADWPKGRVGPPLAGFGDRALIAGALPNRTPLLAKFVRDAPSVVPGSGMPVIPMRDGDARDIAAWLQSLRD
ncbi:MAG: c-type cytochrome [Sphingopyxis sp.]|nr:c-type cytochrome [Sphingopyxis sp.]